MKLLSVLESTITSLYLVGNSQGGRNLLAAASKLVDRYQFKKVPNLEELLSSKQSFQLGTFDGEQIDSFEIYTDGVVVRSGCNSELLEAFLRDVDDWTSTELGFERIETHRSGLMFASEILVELKPGVLEGLTRYSKLSSAIGQMLREQTGRGFPEFFPAGFMFAPNEPDLAGIKPVPFRLERRLGTDFEKNIFVSAAPLQTQHHLQALSLIEKIDLA